MYRNIPGASTAVWAPVVANADLYKDLQIALGRLPLTLVTTVKRACSFKSLPVSRHFLKKRSGCSLLQSYIGNLRRTISNLCAAQSAATAEDDDRTADAHDEVAFVLSFPTTDFEFALHRGFGHALDALENDLCELREMLQNEKTCKSDVAPLIYECKRILRKANTLRWLVRVFVFTCLPFLTGEWALQADETDVLRTSVDSCLTRGRRRLDARHRCLAGEFWHHPTVYSVLQKIRLR